MTINKSQGQTLTRTAMMLSEPYSAHGQFYVVFFRYDFTNDNKNITGMKVIIYDTPL